MLFRRLPVVIEMKTATEKFILVLDQPDFLKTLEGDAKSNPLVSQLLCSAGKEAQLAIGDSKIDISSICINPLMQSSNRSPDGVSVLKFSTQLRPQTPIFLLLEANAMSEPDLEELRKKFPKIKGVVRKPVTYKALLEKALPKAIIFDPSAVKESGTGKGQKDSLDSEITVDDSEFIAIKAADFVSGKESRFDVYIKLGQGKYVKILNAGEGFTPDRVAKYIAKGIENFYLRKEDHQRYIHFCAQVSSKITKLDNVSMNIKLNQSLNYGQEILGFLRTTGLSESNLVFANQFIENVSTLVKKMEMKSSTQSNALVDFTKNIEAYDHGVGTTMVASLIGSAMGIKSESLVEVVGLAALFHDVGLYQLPEEFHSEDEARFTTDQMKVYGTHGDLGAKILESIPDVHPTVIQAVQQHHARRRKLNLDGSSQSVFNINKVAEIVGISDEYVRLIKHPKKHVAPANYRQYLERNVLGGFSPMIVNVFLTTIFKVAA